jgi:hypothetical protein
VGAVTARRLPPSHSVTRRGSGGSARPRREREMTSPAPMRARHGGQPTLGESWELPSSPDMLPAFPKHHLRAHDKPCREGRHC